MSEPWVKASLEQKDADIKFQDGIIRELRAEIERLATENERLRRENRWLYDQVAAQKRTAGAKALEGE